MTHNLTTTITPINATTAHQVNLFIDFHNAASAKAKGNLKPVSIQDILQAAFIVVTQNAHGKIKGQCLLYKGNSHAEKLTHYLPETKSPQSLIITSLSGVNAAPRTLKEIHDYAQRDGISNIYAKTRLGNNTVKDIFEKSGFNASHTIIFNGDDYYSHIFQQTLKKKPIPDVVLTEPAILQI